MIAARNNSEIKKKLLKYVICFVICLAAVIVSCFIIGSATTVEARSTLSVGVDSGEADANSSTLDILFLLAILALIPSFLIMMTSFLRIIVSISFLRNALGTQTSPPNQVLVGIALFLSIFIMFPYLSQIKDEAYDPYQAGELTIEEAITEASVPLKTFMLKQVYETDLDLFLSLADSRGMVDATQ
ncbi:MAG: flagellar biosynthetic protein FliP, partial [Oscillospiraceae bacterium]|nr:flagellar biosynthetic protein FliP [Oscillospiraceae bacterium]